MSGAEEPLLMRVTVADTPSRKSKLKPRFQSVILDEQDLRRIDEDPDHSNQVIRKATKGVSFDPTLVDEGKVVHAKERSKWALIIAMVAVVVMGTTNTIARRVALVPMVNYPYFITELSSTVYVFLYALVVFIRFRRGIITKDMLSIGKRPFLLIGLCDAIGNILGNLGGSHLPGNQLPLLAKLNIPFTAITSYLFLGKRYIRGEYFSMFVVVGGAIISVLPKLLSGQGEDEGGFSVLYCVIYIVSVLPTAVGFVIKESVFKENPGLDIFIVSFYGSCAELVFTMACLPLASIPAIGGVPLSQLGQYTVDGFNCFLGHNPNPEDVCDGAPWAPLIYITANVFYNVSMITLLKLGGALFMFITETIVFPISTLAFAISWPYLPATTVNGIFIVALIVEMMGIFLYKRFSNKRMKVQTRKKICRIMRKSGIFTDCHNSLHCTTIRTPLVQHKIAHFIEEGIFKDVEEAERVVRECYYYSDDEEEENASVDIDDAKEDNHDN